MLKKYYQLNYLLRQVHLVLVHLVVVVVYLLEDQQEQVD